MERPKNEQLHLANILREMGRVGITAPMADQIIDGGYYNICDVLAASRYMNEDHIERGQE